MRFLLILFFILISHFGFADLAFVRLQDQRFIYVIPKLAHESTQEALNQYKKSVTENKNLSQEIPPQLIATMKIKEELSFSQVALKPLLLVLANRGYDQSVTHKEGSHLRIAELSQKLSGKSEIIILPVAALARFDQKNRAQLHSELLNTMSGAISLGGADLDPKLYNQKLQGARSFNYDRDFYELEFVKAWIKAKLKPLFGICRGHQLISVALGFKLKQHIESHGDGVFTDHEIKILTTQKNRLSQLLGTDRVFVNSYHHQEVDITGAEKALQSVDVAAIASDGTVESLESKNGLIWTFQFHPEFMNNRVSKKIFQLINSMLPNPSSKLQCKNVLL